MGTGGALSIIFRNQMEAAGDEKARRVLREHGALPV